MCVRVCVRACVRVCVRVVHTPLPHYFTVGNFKVHIVGGNIIMLQSVQSSGLWVAIHGNKNVDAKVGKPAAKMVNEDIELTL